MADNEDTTAGTVAEEKASRDRSPPFPFIPLEKAVARARELEAQYKRTPGRIGNVINVWGYKSKSSGGYQTIGALKAFGLLEDSGSSGADRKVNLTDLAIKILKDERPGKRQEGLREAALKPKVIAEYWLRWKDGAPPDVERLSELTIDRGFTEDAAKRFIQVYDDTMRHAQMETADKLSDKLLDELMALTPKPPKVGDLVQWEPQGVMQFPEPKRVSSLSEKADFVFVEGSQTGIPVSEVKIMADTPAPVAHVGSGDLRASDSSVAGVAVARPPVRQDIFNLDEGPIALTYPSKMSADSFEDFEGWIHLQLKKIKRGISQ